MYYSFYKRIVSSHSFGDGLYKLRVDNLTEFPNTINALSKFNIYPEVIFIDWTIDVPFLLWHLLLFFVIGHDWWSMEDLSSPCQRIWLEREAVLLDSPRGRIATCGELCRTGRTNIVLFGSCVDICWAHSFHSLLLWISFMVCHWKLLSCSS